VNPLGRVFGMPADVIAGLRVLPKLARDMEKVELATRSLSDVEHSTAAMERHTRVLPEVIGALDKLGDATGVLPGMDERMETIAGAMPVLVEVQRDLAQLPETMDRLDKGVKEMAGVLERLLVSMDELNTTLGHLEGSVGPLGRLAGKLPGGRRERETAEQDGDSLPPPDPGQRQQ
jgi:hypothetical protein